MRKSCFLTLLAALVALPLSAFHLPHIARSSSTSPSLPLPPRRFSLQSSSSHHERSLSLGAPQSRPDSGSYVSPNGIQVDFRVSPLKDPSKAVAELTSQLDGELGVLLTSSYEVPGRYVRWTVGFKAPAIQIEGRGLDFRIIALNERGKVLSAFILEALRMKPELFRLHKKEEEGRVISGSVIESKEYFPEEERSKQPSLFSLVREITETFSSSQSSQLGLYGALGYDLTFQFERIDLKKEREGSQRDLVLYLPDEIIVVDNQKNDAWTVNFDFSKGDLSTNGYPRTSTPAPYAPAEADQPFTARDAEPGAYARSVTLAKEQFRVGNLFEVVLSQVFRLRLSTAPSTVFRRLSKRNPSPYGYFMNLGRNEYLVGASPEMFVRVEKTKDGLRVETCPISGTIERGDSPLEDALQIKKLIQSEKEESELTMCTDVDRNDKSRICVPGSVRVLGRRQIEMYSRLIHTVDHVEGYLREGFDALDAFLCHTWAVTVTGAPKTWAIRFIESSEASPRHWYGGAVGMIGFDGSMNTGLTLRTVRVSNGIAEVRAGATLLHDSDPAAEEAETELKASAMLDAIQRADDDSDDASLGQGGGHLQVGLGKKVLLVDHEDSFVHTLANYVRQTGAEVLTCRSGSALQNFITSKMDSGNYSPDLVLLSPGPGNPSDFHLKDTISAMIERRVPIFGVCLGLQGLAEYFGGELDILSYPMHGKPSLIHQTADSTPSAMGSILKGLPSSFLVARYHSLHARPSSLPAELKVIAQSEDGVVMAVQHSTMPIAAVQFHPESILTSPKHGMRILMNAIENLRSSQYTSASNGSSNYEDAKSESTSSESIIL